MSGNVIKMGAQEPAATRESFEHPFCISADHPSLPGHFPGSPLVPGVILLEQVAMALRTWREERLVRVLEAKFVAPLLPGERAIVRLTPAAAERVRFDISRGDTLLARGTIEGAA